jgi:hypothetical protein
LVHWNNWCYLLSIYVMATTNIDIKVTGIGDLDKATEAINEGVGSVTNLKTQLRTLQQELQTLDPASEKFVELSQKAGEVKDQIKNASEAVNANAGPAFERLGNNASLLTSKLGSLDFGGAAESVKALAANVKGVDFKTLGAELGSFGKSMIALGRALLANPIFLLAAAVTAIIMNFDTLLKLLPSVDAAISGVSVELSQALVNQEKLTAQAKEQLEATTASENSLKLQGLSEREILKLKKAQTDQVIESIKAQKALDAIIAMSQIEAAKRNKEILKGIFEFLTIPTQALNRQIDLVGKALGQDFGLEKMFEGVLDTAANYFFNEEEIKKEFEKNQKALDQEIKNLTNSNAGYQIALNNIEKQGAEERKKIADDELKRRLENERNLALAKRSSAEKINELLQNLEDQKLAAEKASEEKRTQMLADQRDLRIALIQDETEKEIAAVDAKYIELRKQAHGNAELLKQLAEANQKEVDKINDDAAKKESERKRQEVAQKIELSNNAIDALIAINDLFEANNEKSARRQFNINKALSLAQALQNTFLGATAAFASQPGGIGLRIAAASIATAAGLANVVRIAKTKFEPSGGSGGDTGGGGTPSIGNGGGGAVDTASNPQFSALNPSFLGQQGNQPPPVQAYVLGGDVSDELNAQERIRDQSTL